jgi:hypothetical protein
VRQSGLKRVSAVVVICALIGALAGIAGSAAAPSKSSKATQAQKKAKAKAQRKAAKRALRHGPGGPRMFFGGPGGPGGGPVHSEAVVPNADGTGFDTVTSDSGKLTSVDGNNLNITEGTDKAKYKDVSIDAGDSPTVVRNHAKATLGDLKAGDHVTVFKGPKGTFVMAEDDAFIAQEQKDHPGFGFGRHHGHGPPPPGAPGGDYPGDPGSNEQGSDTSGSTSGGSNS